MRNKISLQHKVTNCNILYEVTLQDIKVAIKKKIHLKLQLRDKNHNNLKWKPQLWDTVTLRDTVNHNSEKQRQLLESVTFFVTKR